jgi:excisionase family DNA binding protein
MPELSTYEAARAFDAHPVTLQRLVAVGKLDGHKDENGHWRLSKTSLESWNKKRLARRREKQRTHTALKQQEALAATAEAVHA